MPSHNYRYCYQNAGKSLIQVIDDGQGIYQRISLAFERHATSKIYDINDIMTYSYGFRGSLGIYSCCLACRDVYRQRIEIGSH